MNDNDFNEINKGEEFLNERLELGQLFEDLSKRIALSNPGELPRFILDKIIHEEYVKDNDGIVESQSIIDLKVYLENQEELDRIINTAGPLETKKEIVRRFAENLMTKFEKESTQAS